MDPEYDRIMKLFNDNKSHIHNACYATNNRFAYIYNISDESENQRLEIETKLYNYVPCYDKWCLYCDNKYDVNLKCSKCKTVYFCDINCQKSMGCTQKTLR